MAKMDMDSFTNLSRGLLSGLSGVASIVQDNRLKGEAKEAIDKLSKTSVFEEYQKRHPELTGQDLVDSFEKYWSSRKASGLDAFTGSSVSVYPSVTGPPTLGSEKEMSTFSKPFSLYNPNK